MHVVVRNLLPVHLFRVQFELCILNLPNVREDEGFFLRLGESVDYVKMRDPVRYHMAVSILSPGHSNTDPLFKLSPSHPFQTPVPPGTSSTAGFILPLHSPFRWQISGLQG